jgi:hypothetical protein
MPHLLGWRLTGPCILSPQQPRLPVAELTGLNKWSFTVFEYGEKLGTYRQLFHEFFNIANVKRYDGGQRKATARLVTRFEDVLDS